MTKHKVISLAIAIVILSFSFFGLVQLPGVVNKSFILVKTAIPYPGKTVLVINNFLNRNPFEKNAVPVESSTRKQRERNKNSGLVFFLLSSVLVCNEKTLLLLILILSALSQAAKDMSLFTKEDAHAPPGIQYYLRWRAEFVTPRDRCIECLADKYDMNPILMYGWASMYARRINPHFV
ncbi:MAG: hypothetical protein ABIH89_08745 [Elusimicrobiota bacterium]